MRLKRMLALTCGAGFILLAAQPFAQRPALHYEELTPAQLAEMRAAAEKGDAWAQDKYANTCEGRLDSTNAFVWYQRAAKQGVANSQANLARILITRALDGSGKIVSRKDADDALAWYEKAASYGNRRAQFELGRYYESGTVVLRDVVEAFKWYSLATVGGGHEIAARVSVQRVMRDMSLAELAEGKKRLEKFHLRLEPALENLIKLSSVSGPAADRKAVINGVELRKGDERDIQFEERAVKVRCLEVREKSARVAIEGVDRVKELQVRPENETGLAPEPKR